VNRGERIVLEEPTEELEEEEQDDDKVKLLAILETFAATQDAKTVDNDESTIRESGLIYKKRGKKSRGGSNGTVSMPQYGNTYEENDRNKMGGLSDEDEFEGELEGDLEFMDVNDTEDFLKRVKRNQIQDYFEEDDQAEPEDYEGDYNEEDNEEVVGNVFEENVNRAISKRMWGVGYLTLRQALNKRRARRRPTRNVGSIWRNIALKRMYRRWYLNKDKGSQIQEKTEIKNKKELKNQRNKRPLNSLIRPREELVEVGSTHKKRSERLKEIRKSDFEKNHIIVTKTQKRQRRRRGRGRGIRERMQKDR